MNIKKMAKEGRVWYKVSCPGIDDYKIKLMFFQLSSVFNDIFKKIGADAIQSKAITASIKKELREDFKEKSAEFTAQNPENISSAFDVPPEYFKMLKLHIRKVYKHIKKDVKADGIHLIDWKITRATFIKNGDIWTIRVFIKGLWNK